MDQNGNVIRFSQGQGQRASRKERFQAHNGENRVGAGQDKGQKRIELEVESKAHQRGEEPNCGERSRDEADHGGPSLRDDWLSGDRESK